MRTYDPYALYKKTKIETSSPAELVNLLYDEAIKCCKMANRAIEAKKIDSAHTNLVKVQDILDELSCSINTENGGEVAENLLALYGYMKRRLIEGNIKKDTAIISEVYELFASLRQTWQEAMKIGNKENA
ncbi:MAG: flagellar export chaperone FliS [Firmicutes bacterium]|nr:flagellar export chaperone FliS [Bacillota bacterium]